MPQTPHANPLLLGEKVFTNEDQLDFAQQSRDHNPMHVDAVAARRLLSGRQVVHGIHTLITLLDRWEAPEAPRGWSIGCNFTNPVNVGDRVVFAAQPEAEGRWRLSASVDGLPCTEVTATPRPAPGTAPEPWPPASGPVRRLGPLTAPLDEQAGSQAGQRIEIEAWADTLAQRHPRAASLFGAQALTQVAQLSYFVGMVCPGLHSVFSSLQFELGGAGRGGLRLELRKYDPRFRLFVVAFDGAVQGELRAFLRPPPQPQPAAAEAAALMDGKEFKGTHSLVIGGSRGLGEITAKLVAGGGGDVTISYAAGRADAEAVAADINANGRGRCDTVALDLQHAFQPPPGLDPARVSTVYFFATPRIYAKRNETFNRTAFDEFASFYLQRFHELCLWLDSAARPARVYLPSTVFISERPKGMTEYAMAKAAAEVLADDLNRTLRHVRIVHTRLPRLATDQTASIMKVSVASSLDTLLEVVRAMRDQAR
jgi:NAD(P)-dependent dehydrogenase (short-subunit alcohol dehydrogenase family)